MPIPESLVPAVARVSGFSVMFIDEELDDDQTTGITEQTGQKMYETDVIYDLQGCKVTNVKRGFYIRNGKKIFIKK